MSGAPRSAEPLAIVGMSCRLPGGDGLTEFWNLVRTGSTAWGPLPESRLNRSLYFDPQKGKVGKTYSDMGAIVSDRPIDLARCPIPDEWFDQHDIAHLIVCEVASDALRHAGYDPFQLSERNVGVYIGHTGGSPRVADLVYSSCVPDMARLIPGLKSLERLGESGQALADAMVRRVRQRYPGPPQGVAPDLSGVAASVMVSELFGLQGPQLVVDAACASSFQALALAARSLRQGRIKMALVGGASYCKSDSLVLFSAAQSVSNSGSCPFSANADGLVTAEGYVMFAIKTLSQAMLDGDKIQAVIRGLGVSSDGKGKSLWAPRQEGQVLAVHRAYEGGLDFHRLQYIEAHATSTQVGDATELGALSTALRGRLPEGVKVPIGSIKGNVGHTLETAGVAGMIKTILAMKHGIIPPAVQNGGLNNDVVWEDCPFYVPFKEQPWPQGKDGAPKRAAVNAFGIGGLNVHVVMDEFQPANTKTSISLTGSSSQHALQPHDDEHAVAIVGSGCILPGAFTVQALWDLLSKGVDPKVAVSSSRFNIDSWLEDLRLSDKPGSEQVVDAPLGGFAEGYTYDWRRHKVPPKQVAQANPLQFMLLDAADQAFADGGFHDKPLDRTRVGVVVGARFGGDFSNQLQLGLRLPEFNVELTDFLSQRGVPAESIDEVCEEFRKKLLECMPSLIDETGSFTSSTLASRITKTYNLMGGALALDAGSCSGMAAMQSAVDILREGSCDMVVCASGQRSMDSVTYGGLLATDLLAEGAVRGAFDRDAQGMVPAEGCGVLLLKRLSDARRDGDKIRGVIRAVSTHFSAGQAGPAIVPAMRKAFVEAGVDASQVLAVEAAGFGVPELDRQEANAIREAYGQTPREETLWVGGLCGQLGDVGAAGAMAGMLKASLTLQHGMLPATLHADNPISELNAPNAKIQLANSAVPFPTSQQKYAAIGITSFYGGLAYHAIVDNGLPVPAMSSPSALDPQAISPTRIYSVPTAMTIDAPQTARILRCEANTQGDLVEHLAAWLQHPQTAWETPSQPFGERAEWRLAVVATNVDVLIRRVSMALSVLKSGQSFDSLQEQGVFVAMRPRVRPAVAMLFPGQGSQYLGMLQELCATVPAVQSVIGRVDAELVKYGFETFAELAWLDGERLGKDIWRTQASMLVANWIGYQAVRTLTSQPKMIAAHSFGEFPALIAAGAWSLKTAAEATKARCNAVAQCNDAHGAMLSVFECHEKVQRLISASDQVWICADNGPDQVVVGGQAEFVERFGQRLQSQGIKSRFLAVPCPFHTPLLAAAGPILKQRLDRLKIDVPEVPFVSGTLGRFTSDPDEIRQSLISQLVEPVQFRTSVEKMYKAGARVFIEIGPNSVLTQLSRRTLAQRNDVIFLHLDQKGRGGFEQWLHMQAGLEVFDLNVGASSPVASNAVVTNAAAVPVAAAQVAKGSIVKPTIGKVIRYDATEVRREKMRQAASTGSPASPQTPVRSVQPVHPQSAHPAGNGSKGNGSNGNGSHGNGHHEPVREAVPPNSAGNGSAGNGSSQRGQLRDSKTVGYRETPQRPSVQNFATEVPVSTGRNKANGQTPTAAVNAEEASAPLESLKSTLVEFVVEQTGYPADIVEMDADLESDLGIDSIKKAQLFGELGERYKLSVDSTLSLDDFNTLQSILDYLVLQPSVQSELELVSSSTTLHSAAAARQGRATSTNSHSGFDSSASSSTAGTEKTKRKSAAPLSSQVSADSEPSGVSPNDDWDIENILINFVVEQTGYPADIVELDADLESDLGIDSIKKAQLFGEIGEQFRLSPDPNLSLDDFSTLRQVKVYMQSVLGSAEGSAGSTSDVSHEADADEQLALPADPDAWTSFDFGFVNGQRFAQSVKQGLLRMASTSTRSSKSLQLQANELEELTGLSAGAEVARESLQAWNSCADDLVENKLALWIARGATGDRLAILSASVGEVSLQWVEHRQQGDQPSQLLMLPGTMGCSAGVNRSGLVAVVLRTASGCQLPLPLLTRRLLDQCTTIAAAMELLNFMGGASGGHLILGSLAEQRWYDICDVGSEEFGSKSDSIEMPTSNSQLVLVDDQGVHDSPSGSHGSNSFEAMGTALRRAWPSSFATRNVWQPIHWHQAIVQDGSWSCESVIDNQSMMESATARTLHSAESPYTDFEQTVSSLPALDRSYESNGITHRFVARAASLPAAVQGSHAKRANSNAVVIGHGPVCQVIREQLEQAGLHAVTFVIGESLEATRSSWQALLESHHPATIVLLDSAKQFVSPRISSAASQAAWKEFRNQHLMTPFWMLQDWLVRGGWPASDGSGLCLALVTEQGGDFGLANGSMDIVGGSWVGLAKAIRNEYPAMQLKAVDVQPDEMDARQVCLEIVSGDSETQVGLRHGRRVALRPAQQAISTVSSGQAAAVRLPQPGDAWVVSGGARGVTAVVARAIAQRFDVELHLLGSTQPGQLDPKWLDLDEEGLKGLRSSIMLDARSQGKDPLSTWKNVEKTMELERNMREFAKAGVIPTYHCCDITNWHDVDQVLRKVRNQSGPIRGILHGAGFEAACKFEKKKPELVERTVATKVDGAAALIGLTAQDQVDYFIGFGSTSGWFGGLGQADYSLANAALGQQMLALRTQRPACHATVFHWHAWGEVGMAARPESRFALEAFGLQFMPTREGVAHVLGELEAGLPETHVLITEAKFCVDAIDAVDASDAIDAGQAVDSQDTGTDSGGGAAQEELKQFLVNFVVEQTGYPADIVEMDADMESDLGIDSIKKAQLFGEVSEQFKLSADPNLSLDDFPTLGHVLQYLVEHVGGGSESASQSDAATGAAPTAANTQTVQPTVLSSAIRSGIVTPLIQNCQALGENEWVANLVFDPANDSFLKEHLLMGQPFLPAVVGIEALLEAASYVIDQAGPLKVQNLEILNGLKFQASHAQACTIHMVRDGAGVRCELRTQFVDRAGRVSAESRPLVSGVIGSDVEVKFPEWKSPAFGYYPFYYVDQAAMYHGPKFRQLEGLLLQHDGGFASLKSPDTAELAAPRNGDGWLTPSATLDGCLVACAVFQYLMFETRVDIPQAFEKLVFVRPLEKDAKYFMRYQHIRRDARNSWYDFCVFDKSHQPVIVAEGFRCVIVGGEVGK